MVTCHLNGRVYVRKSIEKHFAQRTREVALFLLSATFHAEKFCSNVLHSWKGKFFYVQNVSALRGLRTYFVHSKPPLISILSWIMPKEVHYGTCLSRALKVEFLRQTYFGGLLRQSAPSTGVIPRVLYIGEDHPLALHTHINAMQ